MDDETGVLEKEDNKVKEVKARMEERECEHKAKVEEISAGQLKLERKEPEGVHKI